MEATVTLGRIRGIPIGIHSTWLIVFGLLTYSLADRVFPARHEGWSAAQYWVAGALASLLLFASVLAHELGHAVVAQARGIPVRRITLFIFGGVAELGEESETPGDEFRIAIAGPAVSVAVAAVAGLLWAATRGVSEHAAAVFAYLASANVLLVLFNLIPAYPLDGGRVFRAALWRGTGSMERATRMAASVGMVIGFLFIVGGIVLVFQATISGIWLVAIGWFLRSAAQQAAQQLVLRRVFEGVRAGALMDREPATVAPGVTLAELVEGYILGRNARGLPVVEGRSLEGIVTLTDVKGVPREEWARLRVRDRMTPRDRLVTVSPETGLDAVLRAMAQRDIHQVPVVRDGALAGLLTRNAVIQFLQLREALPAGPSEAPRQGPPRGTRRRTV